MIGICDDLRKAVLQAAIQGKLTEQLASDGDAETLYAEIQQEKQKLIAEKKIKKEKPLEHIDSDEVPFDIPENWKWVRLGDLGEYRKGPFGSSLTKSMFVPKSADSIKVYEQKNAIKKDYSIGDYFISFCKFKEMKSFEVLPGDIIVSCAGTIGEAYLLPKEAPKGIINQALMRVRLFNKHIMDFWLIYFDYILKKQAKLNSSGTAIKNIPPFDVLKSFCLPLPPLAEQHRIVAKVDELMAKIDELENTEKSLTNLYNSFPGDMKSSLLQAAIQGKLTEQLASDGDAETLYAEILAEKKRLIKEGKIKNEKALEPIDPDEVPFDIPDNWKWVKIAIICNLYTGNSIPEAVKREKYLKQNKDGYCYIGTKDISNSHEIEYSNGVYIPYNEKKFKKAPAGASLLCIEGGSAGKKIGFLSETVCFGNKLCMFYPYLSEPKLIYYWLQTPCFIESFKAQMNGIIGGVKINSTSSPSFRTEANSGEAGSAPASL